MNNDYSYLSGLSKEAQEIIIAKIERGEVNLYHSIMAVLEGRRNRECLQDCEKEKKHYRKYSKRKTDISDIKEPLFDEIFEYIYSRYTSKPRKDKEHPLANKEIMLTSKGALIMALQKCNVSEKNIVGMLGVMDTILRTTSEYKLKNTYKEYLKEHREKES